jgi:signal transduction histidine kinase
MTSIPAARRSRLSSVRARIAIACAGLFLVIGGALTGATYALVDHIVSPRVTASAPAAVPGQPGQRGGIARILNVGASEQARNDRRAFLEYSLAGLGLATVVAGGLGWAVSGRVLRPLRAITQAAGAASQENLGHRLALTGPADELKQLADTFDAMLERLDAAFASQRRFVANASHELRTPLTEIRTVVDVTLADPDTPACEVHSVLSTVRAAVDKSETLIEALLTLARSDRGLVGPTELVDLPTAIEDAIDRASPAAAAKNISIHTDLQPTQVTGDRVLLERLASNLIDNAVRHNLPGGWVHATTRHHAGHTELTITITSSGKPIPPGQAAGLLEPFRRLPTQTGKTTGTGLGLSIVASIAKAHGGHATATARPDGGLEVHITLPTATPPPHPPSQPRRVTCLTEHTAGPALP